MFVIISKQAWLLLIDIHIEKTDYKLTTCADHFKLHAFHASLPRSLETSLAWYLYIALTKQSLSRGQLHVAARYGVITHPFIFAYHLHVKKCDIGKKHMSKYRGISWTLMSQCYHACIIVFGNRMREWLKKKFMMALHDEMCRRIYRMNLATVVMPRWAEPRRHRSPGGIR